MSSPRNDNVIEMEKKSNSETWEIKEKNFDDDMEVVLTYEKELGGFVMEWELRRKGENNDE